MEVSNSCRGHPNYKNYRPFEINKLLRIKKYGWYRAVVGKILPASLILPLVSIQFVISWYYYVVYRRNTALISDELRFSAGKLHPLYKHEELKFRHMEESRLRQFSRRAAMEMNDDFDFDELRIYHYPYRYPNKEMAPQMSCFGPI